MEIMAMGGILIIALIYIPLIGVYIYMMVLMVKLMRRGIKALDIFLEKNDTYL